MEMKIGYHPAAKLLPKPTHAASVQRMPNSGELRTLQVCKNFPKTIDAFIAEGLPQLSLHIHSFQDATVVGLAWPHLAMDALGRAALLRSWSLVLANQDDKVSRVAGARQDILSDLPPGDPGQESFFASKGMMSSTQLAKLFC